MALFAVVYFWIGICFLVLQRLLNRLVVARLKPLLISLATDARKVSGFTGLWKGKMNWILACAFNELMDEVQAAVKICMI